MKSRFLLAIAILMSLNIFAQSLNDYKYVLIPSRYAWTDVADKYQVNSLTSFLFNKYGFEAFQLGSVLPFDMNRSSCNTLTADVIENDSFSRVKLKVVLKDCEGKTVFITEEGTSKNKDYKWAYHEALREAFLSIEDLKHEYNGRSDVNNSSIEVLPEPARVDAEVMTNEQVKEKTNTIVETDSLLKIGTYKSQDGSYYLAVFDNSIIFYADSKKIGDLALGDERMYPVNTSEFSGSGYFIGNQFIIEREIKGIQGVIKMIFEKE